MTYRTCCFFGHRNIVETDVLKDNLIKQIERLITEEKITTFLFGSKGRFDSLCYRAVSELKMQHPEIKRIYVRAKFPHISEDYKSYLLESYEETYFPECVLNSGKLCYIKRNCEMVDKSKFCIIYLDENYAHSLQSKKSGTKIAYEYAQKKNKIIINLK